MGAYNPAPFLADGIDLADGYRAALLALIDGLTPRPPLTVSQWAD